MQQCKSVKLDCLFGFCSVLFIVLKPVLNLNQIRELLKKPEPKEYLPCAELSSGIPLGCITEVSGTGKTEFLIQFLQKNSGRRVVWVEEYFSLFPLAIFQRGISPEQILFVDAGKEIEWVILNALRSQAFPIVIFDRKECDSIFLKRIQLATKRAQSATIWTTTQSQNFWTSSLQLQVKREGEKIEVDVLRKRAV